MQLDALVINAALAARHNQNWVKDYDVARKHGGGIGTVASVPQGLDGLINSHFRLLFLGGLRYHRDIAETNSLMLFWACQILCELGQTLNSMALMVGKGVSFRNHCDTRGAHGFVQTVHGAVKAQHQGDAGQGG
jgi:hypothetical protein